MTSTISSSVLSQYMSPLTRLQNELTSEVSAGAMSASDQSALSSALNDIDSALRSQASSGGSPVNVQSKIDDLIAGEVKSGKLIGDQAAELKSIFANALQNSPQGAIGAGGPPPGGAGASGGAGGSSSSSTGTDPAGQKSSDFGGYGVSSKSILDLQVSIARSKAYEDAATSANNRVEVMYSAVGSIADLLTNFKTQLTAASSGSGADTTSLIESASGFMEDLRSLLNTQYGGRYLFAGSATETAPVDLSSYTTSSSASGTADTSYYRGDSDILSVSVSSEETIRYGVTADNTAFEQAMRALNTIAQATSPVDSNTIAAALDLTTSALDAVTGVQTRLSLNAQRLESAVSRQQDFQSYAGTLSSNLTDVDVASLTAQIATYQAQLEASYTAISKVLSLRLSDYLK